MAWLKLSVRAKIMGTVVAVAAVVLALAAYASFGAMNAANQRGRYLRAAYGRNLTVLKQDGDEDGAIAALIAADPQLVAALERNDPVEIVAAAERMGSKLRESSAPDRLIISDAAGRIYKVSELATIDGAEWSKHKLFKELKSSRTITGEFVLFEKEKGAYRVSGTFVAGRNNAPVGAVVLARALTPLLQDIAETTGADQVPLQYRFALVNENGVIAHAFRQSEVAGLVDAHRLIVSNSAPAAEGEPGVPVVPLREDGGAVTTYDFWSEELRGLDGSKLGQLHLLRSRDHRLAQLDKMTLWMNGVLGGAMLLALIVGYVLAAVITRPIRRYIVATEGLARGEGDLTQRLPVQSSDELGELATNLNRVFGKIHQLAANVQKTAFQVNASSGEIATVSRQMLDGAKEQARSVGNSTAAVTELSSSIQQVAENAAEASRTAKQSGEAVTAAMQRLDRIRHAVDDAAHRIRQLGESGKRIGNIVEVIRQISEQTTMLALNAAIEAAHAGEHGRGFAVVADEVSSLAKRVGQSARDIEDLIATLRDQTGEAVVVMQSGTHEVEEGTALVQRTLDDLRKLVNAVDDTASAVQEQALASDEIARNMDAVRRIADNVVSSSENAVAQGEHLQELAESLESSVRGFKLEPDDHDDDDDRAAPEGRAALSGGANKRLPRRS